MGVSMSWRESVLKRIKPTSAEECKIKKLVEKILATAHGISKLECMTCGSFGKGTWLAGDLDIDIFIRFSKETSRETLEKNGLSFGKRIVKRLGGKWHIKYAEHPYVHAIVKGIDIDVVPCYAISAGEHIKSAVDRSPLHLAYINQTLKPELFDEVRLLKQFMKGTGVYGSDTKTQGFSGYIAELLMIKYGSFEKVVAEVADWNSGASIGFGAVSDKQFKAPLVIIDPIDPDRNVSAAVSGENFIRFVYACKRFLKHPDISFFFPVEKLLSSAGRKALQDRGTKWIALVMKRPNLIDDTLWPQLRRACNRTAHMLFEHEFRTIRSLEWADEYSGKDMLLLFELEIWRLPHIERMVGPLIYSNTHSKNFIEKYRNAPFGPIVHGDSWVIEKHRAFHNAIDLLRWLQRKQKKELLNSGIPGAIAPLIQTARLLEDASLWNYVKKNSKLSAVLHKAYFEKMG
jgi:tRNA nucleotidyltransferase (CCA-adding enzyme)